MSLDTKYFTCAKFMSDLKMFNSLSSGVMQEFQWCKMSFLVQHKSWFQEMSNAHWVLGWYWEFHLLMCNGPEINFWNGYIQERVSYVVADHTQWVIGFGWEGWCNVEDQLMMVLFLCEAQCGEVCILLDS